MMTKITTTDLFKDILGAEPTPAPSVEKPHVLVYHGEDDFEVEHLETCINLWDDNYETNCGIQFEFDNSGLGTFFTGEPEDAEGWYAPTLITIPGRYWIEWWQDKSYHHEYGWEYSSGVQLMYPEEVENG
jgi:hypothetical protein